MEKLSMRTPDLAEENYRKLAALFPHAVTETISGCDEQGRAVVRRAVDADVLAQEISAAVIAGPAERYQFTWPDKRRSAAAANAPTTSTLRPCRAESVDFDRTENLYIEGDNLEALKLLRETYLGKIRIIYIDPPYNTGNDFVYRDDFTQPAEAFARASGQRDESGNLLFSLRSNTESSGRFHTDWLNMIYPRLRLAKDLLADDGLLMMSIDDHEAVNAQKCLDEVFGSRNFLNHFAWVTNITGRQISGAGAAKTWESVLVYAKNAGCAPALSVDVGYATRTMPDAYKGFHRDILRDEAGEFAVGDTLYNHNRKFNEETRRNLVFSILYCPETGEITTGELGERREGFVEIPPHPNRDGIHKYHAWRWSRQKIARESRDLIVLPTASGRYEIYTKIRGFERTALKDLITNIPNGDAELQKLFGGRKVFDYPKSLALMKVLLGAVPGKDGYVLDFFSGSATTAHAVMQLNAEDGGRRRFILVQLPERTGERSAARKAGYTDICQIGRERIRRAAEKISKDCPEAVFDGGFRVFRCDSSNMRDVYYRPGEWDPGFFDGAADNIKAGRTPEDLLFQVMLELGIPLSSEIAAEELGGRTVLNAAGGLLLACFDRDVPEETFVEAARRKPRCFVVRDSSLGSDAAAENFRQIFETYSPGTMRRVL